MLEQVASFLRWQGALIAATLPTLVTWCYFVLLAESDSQLQQGVYSVAKVIQFGFPVFWVLVLLKRPLRKTGIASLAVSDQRQWTPRVSLAVGMGVGLAVVTLLFGIYYFAFPKTVQEQLSGQLVERVQGFSVDSFPKFLGLSLFYALLHSLLEEYYFRWFIFGQLRHVMHFRTAMLMSSLAFMAHHVIVLAHYFGGLTPLTLFLSVSIAIGGMIWAWHYERSRSLWGPWLSHLLVDAGIFALGFFVLRNAGVF